MLAVAAPPSESGVLFLSRWPGPGVALKVMRVFKCRYIEGQYWLEADMRLQCYTSEWAGYVPSVPGCACVLGGEWGGG